ncbi:MAG: flagellar basal body-associated FliL family protein [Pseudomonadota bacterium]
MAEEEQDQDQEQDGAEEVKGGGLLKKLIFVGVGLVLVGAGIFLGPMFLGGGEDEEAAEGEETAEVADVPSAPPIYQSLHPPLVVNVRSEAGDSHFMQITMEVMSRNQGVINSIRDHTPVIRNSLILLYGNVLYESTQTREGKERMLADGLAEIRRVMQETTGRSEDVEDIEALYFTALVIQ